MLPSLLRRAFRARPRARPYAKSSKTPGKDSGKDQQQQQQRPHSADFTAEDCLVWDAIGNREVVGFGMNGQPMYVDHLAFPFPAIRWRESTAEVLALREKEKGDWKALSEADKKALYRSSYRQTLAELKAPTGQWKSVVGSVMFLLGCGIWGYVFIHMFVHNPLPFTLKEDVKRHQLKRMLDLKVNPITGLSSKWDYDKEQWK